MALEFSHGVDNAFLEDNFLSAEDWVFQNDLMDSDVISDAASLENFGITLGSDHFGMIQDDISSDSSTKSWNGLDDDFTSTIDVEVKEEPSSPSLSLGSTDSSSGGSDFCYLKLESPPLTPPHEPVTPITSLGLLQETYQPLNLIKSSQPLNLSQGSLHVSSAPTQNSYVLRNSNSMVPPTNGLQIVNGNIPQGAHLVNANFNKFNLVPVSIDGSAPNVVMTTTANGLPNGLKLHVVNGGTKRAANGTIKSGGRGAARKAGNSAPKRDAMGVTIHPPIVPKVNTVPSTIATMTSMPAAKAIVFSRTVNTVSRVSTPCQQSPVTVQQPITLPQPPDHIRDEKELMAWKRQQRMIKNRESASLSRKKKKEYVHTLEQKMQGVVRENALLREENSILKKRLCASQEEVQRLKTISSSKSSSPLSGKYVTCLLTVILFLGINLAPFSPFSGNIQPDQYALPAHHGRTLLAFEEERPQNASDSGTTPQMADILKNQYYNETLLRLHDESSQHLLRLAEVEQALLMQQALNLSYIKERSEEMSARLMEALEKLSPDKEKDVEGKEGQDKPNKKTKRLRKERRRKLEAPAASWQMESDERSLQIYDSFFIRHYENLIDSLDRKHDTYYIVSFTRDHLLLPAMSRNSTQRPKMSLVMPAGGNGTMWNTPPDHMTMMQIDCEVTNTRTIYMPDVKEHVILNETETTPSHNISGSDDAPSNASSHPRAPTGTFKTPPSPPLHRQKPLKFSRLKHFKKGKKDLHKSNSTET